MKQGLNCIKGEFNDKMMFGADRLTPLLMHMKKGQFDRSGPLVVESWR